MSDIMRPISFGNLMTWMLQEHKSSGSVFGVEKLAKHGAGDAKLPIYKEKLESPFGPAAGPHTQLAQNIIAAYLAGGRFFELKTVQILDGEDLPVSKPCITAADECYNCEWSTELRVPDAFNEYVKAWFALKLISKELGLGAPDGFVFNMSVGYDLSGIKTDKIDKYIEGMKEAADTDIWKECKEWALDNLAVLPNIDKAYVESIPSKVSDSITLSTLHGCPPDEIERIAAYLITEKNLNTYIKCNPTLLGYEYARKTLDELGFDYIVFDDHHFKGDLQFADAVPMFKRLQKLTDERGLEFGVKLTNTFPVTVAADELPSEEMYMSGRSLFPLSIAAARMVSEAFDGKLRISYSGGADVYNIRSLYDAGIWPITMATTLLKPGGYQRLAQIAELFRDIKGEAFAGVSVSAVIELAEGCKKDEYYRKPIKPLPNHKVKEEVPLVSCFISPCRDGCPISQDIPAYLRLVGEGKYLEALKVITERNPLPFITGTICSHRCMDKCVRGFYEESVHIRGAKLEAAEGGYDALLRGLAAPKQTSSKKVAVVGGGAAGLSAAFFLARAGVAVTIFEKTDKLGGIVRHVIPEFRISADAIDKDVALVKAMGVEIRTGVTVKSVEELKSQGFTDVILASGAWKPGSLRLEYGESMNVLDFLAAMKTDPAKLSLGEDVVIIGGGNTAMDAARAAKRAPGVKNVRIVYRRDKRNMPADEEELGLALEDGVEFCELLAPVGVKDGVLHCKVMELGERDASGRRSPVDTGKTTTVSASTVIAAVGESPDSDFYAAVGVEADKRGRPVVDENLFSKSGGVYAIGDANRGPATVVEAIADGMKAAQAITAIDFKKYEDFNVNPDYSSAYAKKGKLDVCGECGEGEHCLECVTVCELCTDVCPNRANVAVKVPGLRMRQIIHVDGMCNECGNCETFCPWSSAPYKDKFTLYWNAEDFENSKNSGFLLLGGDSVRVRLEGKAFDCTIGASELPADISGIIKTVRDDYAYLY